MTQPSAREQRGKTTASEPPTPPENVRLALAALALRGPTNISGFLEAAGVLGARESERRAFSTETLRVAIAPYLEAGWVHHTDGTYRCEYGLAPSLLRSFEKRPLEELGARYLASLRRPYYGGEWSRDALEAQVRLGLAGGYAEWPAALDRLLSQQAPLEVTASLLHEPLTTFERAWFSAFPTAEQRRLCALLLDAAEVVGFTLGRFADYANEPQSIVQSDPGLLAHWARVQVLRTGVSALPTQTVAALPPSSGVAFFQQMASGDFNSARIWLQQAFGSKRAPLLAGAAGVLQVMLLMRGERPGDVDEATRLAASGARAGNSFKDSFATIKRVLAAQGSRGHWIDVNRPRQSPFTDVLFELVSAYCTVWFADLSPDASTILTRTEKLLVMLRRGEAPWLLAQYEDALAALARVVAKDERAPSKSTPAFPPLRLLFVAKPAWEAALGRLEGLALQASPAASRAGEERLIWRLALGGVEPYLQRSTATGWTRGRKLALKHLLPGAAQRQTLPPEDLRVAEYARETVSNSGYGYREVYHSLERGVWEALIGHPRVFDGDVDWPIEVTKGTLQLLAKSVGSEFHLEVHPAGISEQNSVRREGDRLVVYSIDKETQRVLDVIADGLVVPVAQRERLLTAAARLTHLVSLQSSEPSFTEARAGDTTPYLRLSPRGAGLTVALRVRPLGEGGPALIPGVGAPVLVAQVEGTAVQARRELPREAELAQQVLDECGVLDGLQSGDHEWLLEAPEQCLTLLATLTELGNRVKVEWPHGKPLVLRGRLERSSLRGSLRRSDAGFFLEASLELDAELELPLAELLRLFGAQRGRFVRLDQGDFVELSADLQEQLSALAGARSEGESTAIALPPTALAALEGLMAEGTAVELDAPAQRLRSEFAKVFDSKPRVPRTLNAELRDYQVDGFRWLARLGELGFGACLADDMGLGKTVQLIALLLHRSRSGPALVVAPTSVCENWSRELQRFAPSLNVVAYSGAEREQLLRDLGPRRVVVTGYATLQQDAAALQAVTWGTVILDEAQFIKNAVALRTKAALGLRAGMRVAATGTPVENHAEDLYSLFQFVQPGLLGTPTGFRRRFPLAEDSPEGRESRRDLRKLIQPFLLRRTKAQVLKELPPVTEIEHQVELGPEETVLYEAVRRAALEKLGAGGDGNKIAVLAELTRLRRLCCDARLVVPDANIQSSKLKAFQTLMQELVEARHRVLVFSQFVDVLQFAGKALEELSMTYQYLDGSSTTKQRTASVDAFQAGEGDAFLISLKAGGFGLNLTAADYVIHLDPWWNPAAEAQATDRAHRIGQQNPVTLYRLVAKGTIEERIVALHRTKRELADSLLSESDQAARLSSAELRSLLEWGVVSTDTP